MQANRAVHFFAAILLTACATAAAQNNSATAGPSGQRLAREIWRQLQQEPPASFTNSATLEIERRGQPRVNVPIFFETFVGLTNFAAVPAAEKEGGHGWEVIYDAQTKNAVQDPAWFAIYHSGNRAVCYAPKAGDTPGSEPTAVPLTGNEAMVPFAGSDFWLTDLGLQFFQWPDQKIIGHETRRTRACAVLDSANPDPAPGTYSHVVSWIDNETLGIVHAEAYDVHGKLLKAFDPKSFKKVNGRWELQDMEIRNVQTHSRTWIKFHLQSG